MTKIICDYTTVAKDKRHELEDAVKTMIELYGWQPMGGVTKHHGQLIQAMVKYG